MEIKTRLVGCFVEVKISIGDTTVDCGLCNKDELERLSQELLSASLEIQDRIQQIKP